GPSFAMLVARYWGENARVFWLGAVPILFYWVSVGATLQKEKNRIQGDDAGEIVKRILQRLGIASFATLLPLGLLLKQNASLAFTLQHFSPLICLFAAPAIASVFLLLQKGDSSLSGEQRTTVMSIGIVALMVATSGVVIAWPNPLLIITTTLINFGIYTIL